MKSRIIRALRYPRALMRGNIALDQCTHSGHYNESDQECGDCYYGLECEWLFGNDESVAVEEKSLPALIEALEYCHGYVDAHTTEWGHDSKSCPCEACAWLRDTEELMTDLQPGT